jgi:hypothetical protein
VDADVNMKAVSWSRDRDRRMVQRKKSKIHKVMHCQTSVGTPSDHHHVEPRRQRFQEHPHMLLMMEIRGFERPKQFKPTSMPSRRVRAMHRLVPIPPAAYRRTLSERAPLQ